MVMDIWHKIIVPVRRVWLALSARLNPPKHGVLVLTRSSRLVQGTELLKLQDDVQTCEYQDVQVMWEMLWRTERECMEKHHKRKHQPVILEDLCMVQQ